MKSVRERLPEFVEAITSRFDVERIILFGSHAAGDPHQDSDIDLLVLMEHHDDAFRRCAEIRGVLPRDLAFDILVMRPSDFRQRVVWKDALALDAERSGIVLYERSRAA